MPNYRRPFVPGGTFFFTVTTSGHQPVLTEPAILAALRDAVRQTRRALPFTIVAWVVLPDHLHAIWELPPGDADFSLRWARIKQTVTRVYAELPFARETRSPSRTKRREGTLWQRRFWEHQIRDEIDLVRHVDYIHYNPVKHGHASRVREWRHSTFHKYVRSGIYPQQWGDEGYVEGSGNYGE
jgi:putative transposase